MKKTIFTILYSVIVAAAIILFLYLFIDLNSTVNTVGDPLAIRIVAIIAQVICCFFVAIILAAPVFFGLSKIEEWLD